MIRFVKGLRPADATETGVYVPELVTTLGKYGHPRATGRRQELIQRIFEVCKLAEFDDRACNMPNANGDTAPTSAHNCVAEEEGYYEQLRQTAIDACLRRDRLHEAAMNVDDVEEAYKALGAARLVAQDALAELHLEREAQEAEADDDEEARELEMGARSSIVLRRSGRATAGRAASVFDPAEAAAMPQWAARKRTRNE